MRRSFKIFAAIVTVTVILCCSIAESRGREYLPVLEDGKVWVYSKVNLEADIDGMYYDTVYFKTRVVGDTVVYGKPCKKLTVSGMNGENPRTKVQYEENGRLYSVVQNGMLPIMDMNYQKGDIMPTYDTKCKPDGNFSYVYNTGTTTTPDDRDRKYMIVSAYMGVWVEGIGYNDDFVTLTTHVIPFSYIGTFLESCSKDGKVLFTRSDFERIKNKHTGIDESVMSNPLSVSYSDGSVSAVCDGNQVSLELYSPDGRMIAGTRSDDGRASLETSALPGGIYIAHAACGKHRVVRKIAL